MAAIRVGSQNQLAPEMLDSMHEFRRAMFVGRLDWALPLIGGTERDQYDTAEAIYLIAYHEDARRVTACARLLPTTGSYMLPELFPELLGETPAPRHPSIWELSRFAADVRSSAGGRVLSFSETARRRHLDRHRAAVAAGRIRSAPLSRAGARRRRAVGRIVHRSSESFPARRGCEPSLGNHSGWARP